MDADSPAVKRLQYPAAGSRAAATLCVLALLVLAATGCRDRSHQTGRLNKHPTTAKRAPDKESQLRHSAGTPVRPAGIPAPARTTQQSSSTARGRAVSSPVNRAASLHDDPSPHAHALSAIAQEVALAIEQRPTLVLWLFDQSPSAEELRRGVVRSLPRFYASVESALAASNTSQSPLPLRSAVVGVSDAPYIPSAELLPDATKVSDLAAGLTTADGTAERTFAAIDAAMDAFVSPTPQYLFLVIVSDEAGDDEARVDEIAAKLTRAGVVVHVIGYPAVFGDGWPTSLRSEFDASHDALAAFQI
jgi:hypothetical protein